MKNDPEQLKPSVKYPDVTPSRWTAPDMEPFELGREIQCSQEAEIAELKELLTKATVRYELSEKKRKTLSKKLSDLKADCRIHSDKLLNSERNRLLAEYNLFMSEKKIRKLEKTIKKLTVVKKTQKDCVSERTASQTSLPHPDEELTGLPLKKELPSSNLLSREPSPTRCDTLSEPDKSLRFKLSPTDCASVVVSCIPLKDLMKSSSMLSRGSFRSLCPQPLLRSSSEKQNNAEVRSAIAHRHTSSDSLRSRQEEVEKLNSRLQVLRSFCAESSKEVEEKRSSIKEKEKLVSNIKEEIAKIREIFKIKTGVTD